MVHTAGWTADGGRARGFQVNSAKIINKYQRKYDKQQEKHYEEDDDGFVSRPKMTLKYILEIMHRISKIHVKASNN